VHFISSPPISFSVHFAFASISSLPTPAGSALLILGPAPVVALPVPAVAIVPSAHCVSTASV